MNTVYCPVLNEQVDGGICITICCVADKEAKPTILSANIKWNDEQRKKCLSCKYHSSEED